MMNATVAYHLRAASALGAADIAGIRRDPLLRWMIVAPPALALIVRFVLPSLFERVGALIGYDLRPDYPLLVAYMLLLLAPQLVGMVVGFLLLDMRDDDTLTALRVTPLPPLVFLGYRLAAPLLVSIAATLVAFAVAGIPSIDMGAALVGTLLAAPLAPIAALALAAFAANKVQGFALVKLTGLFTIVPLIAHYTAERWQWLFWVFPTYWPARVVRLLYEGAAGWGAALAGVALEILLLVILARRVM